MAKYTWSNIQQLEDSIASGRFSAEALTAIPGLATLSMAARRDAVLAELLVSSTIGETALSAATFGFLPGASGAANGAALQTALTAAASGLPLVIPAGNYTVAGTATIGANTTLIADGATITQATPLIPLLKASAVDNITLRGGKYIGVGSATAFTDGDAGLIYFVNSGGATCDNIRLYDMEVSDTASGISTIRCQRVWVERCYIHDYRLYGIVVSRSAEFHINTNTVLACTQSGAAVAYAIMATGDEAGGAVSRRCSIADNIIDTVPSWDGIMSHDAHNLLCHGNIITNVRNGIDVGHFNSANVMTDVTVTSNQVSLTTTDTWAGAAAQHDGIYVCGLDATHRIMRAVVSENIVNGSYSIVGGVAGGLPGSIVCGHIDDLTLTGNPVAGVGTAMAGGNGIVLFGTINRLALNGNVLQGSMSNGGIRTLSGTVGTRWSLGPNVIEQATVSDYAVIFDATTITGLAIGPQTTNSTNPILYSGLNTLTLNGDTDYAGGYRQAVSGWYQTNIPAAQAATEATRGDGRFLAPSPGSVLGIQVALDPSQARSAGTLTAEVWVATIDPTTGARTETATGLTVVIDGTNPAKKLTSQAKDLDLFAAGDEVFVKFTTDGSWAPTTADPRCTIFLEC